MLKKANFLESVDIPSPSPTAANTKTRLFQSNLKYYIHDSLDAFRFELKGELTGNDLGELNGCWQTAKTTLGSRKLIIDLRSLAAVDDEGRQWLNTMSAQGASIAPETQFHLQPAGQVAPSRTAGEELPKRFLISRLVAFYRGVRVSVIRCLTQAQ